MKKVLSTLSFIALASCSIQAQSLKDLFLKMPQEVCPVLSEYNRLELVDNQKNNKPMQTRNLLRKISTMKELTDDYTNLAVSSNSEKAIKLLPKNDGTKIIMVINTVWSDSIADSSLSFYSTDWQPLDAKEFINEPVSAEFRKISVNPATNTLSILTSQPFVIKLAEDSAPPQKEPISSTFLWNGESFKQG